AVRVHEYGGPDQLVLDEVALPTPTAGEALVRVCAAGVGPWDALLRTGNSGLSQTLPLIPGSDIAGVVEATGEEVYGVTNPSFAGGYAQYATASRASIARKPSRLSFVEAASVPVVAVTAWQLLFDHANVAAGQRVLVHGAAGNVGAYAVQLARWAGAEVVATAGSGDLGYVSTLGAEEVIDFQAQRFEEHASAVDAVIDTVGGATQERSFSVIKPGGIIVSSVSPPAQTLAAKYGVRAEFFIVSVTSAQLERIGGLIDDGVLQTDVGIVLDLTDARLAHEMLAGEVPHPRGKIVLRSTTSAAAI
ncbi:MAG TPA: NADP-dependent oxidoreductase, partial [Candidatus Nitrosotalea sp.]|nr:NADP-dependent oxidoreductase [Candidatus Nitrosotalea sp.]